MAKELLNAVIAAENECNGIISNAKAKAKETDSAAQKEAEKIIAEKTAAAAAEADEIIKSANDAADKIIEQAKLSSNAECESILKAAEKNRRSVIENAVSKFF